MSRAGLMSEEGNSSRNYGAIPDHGRGNNDLNINIVTPGGSNNQDSLENFTKICENITSNIFAIRKHASTLEKTLRTIGSANDSSAVRESIHVLQVTANRTIGETAEYLKKLNQVVHPHNATSKKEDVLRLTRLTNDFQSTVQRYTDLQKQIVVKMKTTLLPVPMSRSTSLMGETEDQSESLIDAEAQKQAQLQLQQELEFEQGLLIEREQKIREIESDILDVNVIMRDLAGMVHEQGEALDTIEQHIDATHVEVEGGREELQKASTYQRKYRKKLFCLLGAGLIALIITIIVLVVELKK